MRLTSLSSSGERSPPGWTNNRACKKVAPQVTSAHKVQPIRGHCQLLTGSSQLGHLFISLQPHPVVVAMVDINKPSARSATGTMGSLLTLAPMAPNKPRPIKNDSSTTPCGPSSCLIDAISVDSLGGRTTMSTKCDSAAPKPPAKRSPPSKANSVTKTNNGSSHIDRAPSKVQRQYHRTRRIAIELQRHVPQPINKPMAVPRTTWTPSMPK
mmetsp:Transcript_62414/g.115874  ORF Transcript_62414/g.115874 Transcript_62414/m.115874 type:complete len:211 (-) Transcript_62414:738-1370(-)